MICIVQLKVYKHYKKLWIKNIKLKMLVWKIHSLQISRYQDGVFKDHEMSSSRVLTYLTWYSCWKYGFEWILLSVCNY
jgi:hypothetical protein